MFPVERLLKSHRCCVCFSGYFDLTIIELTQTGLKKFDEAVFKPLYSGYTGPRIVAIQSTIFTFSLIAILIILSF